MKQNQTMVRFLSKIRYLFYGVTHEDSVEKVEDVPDYIQEATAFFLIFVIIEAIYLSLTNRKHQFRVNEALSSFSSGLLMKLFMIVFANVDFRAYVWFYNKYKMMDVSWNSKWAWWICFLGVDLCYYWFHRMAHEINIMWAAHQVHHSSEDFNLGTAIRKSVFQHCTSWIFYLPLALFIPPQIFIAHIQFNLLYQFWIHTIIIGKLGPFEWILNTPSHHRVHHGRNPYCINKNYAGVFIVWDRLFGTFEEESEQVVYGLTILIDSFDPVYVQVCRFVGICKRLQNSTGWSETFKILFYGPGWSPGKPRLGCKHEVPKITTPLVKYHPSVSSWQNWNMLINFFVATICFQEFNKNVQYYSSFAVAFFVIYILICLTAIGATLDNKSHSPYLHLSSNLLFLLGQKYSNQMTFLPLPYAVWLGLCLKSYAILSTLYWGSICISRQSTKLKIA